MPPFPLTTDTFYTALEQVNNLDLLTIDLPLDQCTCLPLAPGIVLSVCAETFNAPPYAETFNAPPVIHYLAWLSNSTDLRTPLHPTHCGPWRLGTRSSLFNCVIDELFRLFDMDLSMLEAPGVPFELPPPHRHRRHRHRPPCLPVPPRGKRNRAVQCSLTARTSDEDSR
ncbi:MAG: hypothetical protein WCG26_09010 [Chloroflexales bacterium]